MASAKKYSMRSKERMVRIQKELVLLEIKKESTIQKRHANAGRKRNIRYILSITAWFSGNKYSIKNQRNKKNFSESRKTIKQQKSQMTALKHRFQENDAINGIYIFSKELLNGIIIAIN